MRFAMHARIARVAKTGGVVLLLAGLNLLGGPIRGQDPSSVRYEFKQDLERVVIWRLGNAGLMVGKLDGAGNVVPSDLPQKIAVGGSFVNLPYHVNQPRGPNGVWNVEKETVYEFRSGFLIRGTLVRSGSFIPQEAGKIIPFKDYQNPETSPRIYNLPGYFEKIENGKVTKRIDSGP
jgi:hypothetical protein